MTTDKEVAATRRQIADLYESIGRHTRACIERKNANELDPPQPEYPDGTAAWVTNQYGRRYLCTWHAEDREWCIGGPAGGSAPNEVTKVEPLRVLADDEIAVKRVEVDYMGPCDTTAQFMRQAADRADKLGHGSHVTRAVRQVLHGYAKALDAEAGDQS